jgi:hypothetical protein
MTTDVSQNTGIRHVSPDARIKTRSVRCSRFHQLETDDHDKEEARESINQ